MGTELTRVERLTTVRERRQVARDLAGERMPAKRAAARLESAAYAAFVGLVNTEILTSLEAQVCQRQGSLIDQRAKQIVDTYAGLCSTELARLALCQ